MKLQDLLKDIELGKVYTDKDRKPFKVNEDKCICNCHQDKIDESYMDTPQAYSSKEAKAVIDGAIRNYAKDLRKVQHRVIKDWMSKAKAGVIDYFDIVRGLQTGDVTKAHPYEVNFLQSVLNKDKIIDRFRKYFGGGKSIGNRINKRKW